MYKNYVDFHLKYYNHYSRLDSRTNRRPEFISYPNIPVIRLVVEPVVESQSVLTLVTSRVIEPDRVGIV